MLLYLYAKMHVYPIGRLRRLYSLRNSLLSNICNKITCIVYTCHHVLFVKKYHNISDSVYIDVHFDMSK